MSGWFDERARRSAALPPEKQRLVREIKATLAKSNNPLMDEFISIDTFERSAKKYRRFDKELPVRVARLRAELLRARDRLDKLDTGLRAERRLSAALTESAAGVAAWHAGLRSRNLREIDAALRSMDRHFAKARSLGKAGAGAVSVERSGGEHWFDRLSRPHSRGTALKAAAAAAMALALPNVRLPRAWATPGEPCWTPCNDAALDKWNATVNGCSNAVLGRIWASVATGSYPNLILATLESVIFSCGSRGEVTWHRDVLACRGSECGDPSKYPGGRKPPPPPPKCDPTRETVCGDICCNIVAECCPCKGGFICCASGANCKCGACTN